MGSIQQNRRYSRKSARTIINSFARLFAERTNIIALLLSKVKQKKNKAKWLKKAKLQV